MDSEMFTRRAAGSPGKGANRRRAEYGEEINFAICIIEASIRGSTGITSNFITLHTNGRSTTIRNTTSMSPQERSRYFVQHAILYTTHENARSNKQDSLTYTTCCKLWECITCSVVHVGGHDNGACPRDCVRHTSEDWLRKAVALPHTSMIAPVQPARAIVSGM